MSKGSTSDANILPEGDDGWQLLDTNPNGPAYLCSSKDRLDESRRQHVLTLIRHNDGTYPANWSQMAAQMERFLRDGTTGTQTIPIKAVGAD